MNAMESLNSASCAGRISPRRTLVGMGELNEISRKIQSFIRQISSRRFRLRIYRAVCCAQCFFLHMAESASARTQRDPPGARWNDHSNSRSDGDTPFPVCHAKSVSNGASGEFSDSCGGGGKPGQFDPFAGTAIAICWHVARGQNRLHLFYQPD